MEAGLNGVNSDLETVELTLLEESQWWHTYRAALQGMLGSSSPVRYRTCMQRACAVAFEAHGYMPTSYAPGQPPAQLLPTQYVDEQVNPPKEP